MHSTSSFELGDYDPRKPEYITHVSECEANSLHAALLRRQIAGLQTALASQNDDFYQRSKDFGIYQHYEVILMHLSAELKGLSTRRTICDIDSVCDIDTPATVGFCKEACEGKSYHRRCSAHHDPSLVGCCQVDIDSLGLLYQRLEEVDDETEDYKKMEDVSDQSTRAGSWESEVSGRRLSRVSI
eukprot:CAMPEP_0169261300 /NCGR_PEP_ID=MMETSP1016-20121227/43018_1 /TAXON_ID=342587 /ORGANISM="Karlodinium micrum, Strain CCMP2283" /LENGTH=184 /DNA_ID=CAMNT_0009343585 /DNA_START=80 /DNA_END=637 /DNA_ORIENTATION=-